MSEVSSVAVSINDTEKYKDKSENKYLYKFVQCITVLGIFEK